VVDRLREGRPFANKTVAETLAEATAEFEDRGIQCLLIAGFDSDGDLYIRSARLSRANANWLVDAVKDDILHGDTKIGIHPVNEESDDDGRKIIEFKDRAEEKNNE
jgi:hypothetical protein